MSSESGTSPPGDGSEPAQPQTAMPSATTPATESLVEDSKEGHAFVSWINAVVSADAGDDDDEQRTPESPSRRLGPSRFADLADGTWLLRILSRVDAEHFRNPHLDNASGSITAETALTTDPVVRLGTLKRLHKLMAQYYTDTLQQSIDALEMPDVNEIARSSSPAELAKLCKLAIGITIQSDNTKTSHVAAIQTLSQDDQQSLMIAIEQVMSSMGHKGASEESSGGGGVESAGDGDASASAATAATLAQLEQSRKEHQELQRTYLALVDQHQSLKGSHEDAQTEQHELNKEIERLHEEAERRKTSGGEALLRGEVENLKAQLRKSEDNLAEAENEVERLTKVETDLNKKLTDLQSRADEATKLKDQIDEYRHIADKAQRTENALEKYKKKLEESAGVRRQLKDLEEQNSELIDRNASLERDYAKLADFKPLMENYKGQIDELNTRNGRLNEELATAKYNQEQSTLQVKALEEARSKDAEELQLYQERVEELELGMGGGSGGGRPRRKGRVSGPDGAEGLAANDGILDDGDDGDDVLVDDELENALQGTTMTDLKLRVHQLSREVKAAKRNKADSSRILVLENLLEDSQRLKKKYEDDYWREYKSRLQLSGEMEKIRSGTSGYGDGQEASYALRLRLNEVVAECDSVKQQLAEMRVQFDANERELTVARSDLTLVNKDQLDVLSSLRQSVGGEKAHLEEQVSQLKRDLDAAQEDSRKLSAQIQSLLMDKINLMEGGWTDRQDALKRERELGQLRTSLAGKSLPPDVEEMVLRLSTTNSDLQAQLTALGDRMQKAKTFIRQQDKLLKEARAGKAVSLSEEEASASSPSSSALARENAKLKREQELMLAAWHHLAMHKGLLVGRGSGAAVSGNTGGGATGTSAGMTASGAAAAEKSWLGKEQRIRMGVRSILGRR